jgi:hypothetical protein
MTFSSEFEKYLILTQITMDPEGERGENVIGN